MEYFNNIMCVEGGWLYQDGQIMSKDTYDNLRKRKKIKVIRRGCKGTPALIAYDSIPYRFRKIIIDNWGDPYAQVHKPGIADEVVIDNAAIDFYQRYRIPSGDPLPEKAQLEYVNNASVLNTIHIMASNGKQLRKARAMNTKGMWENLAGRVAGLQKDIAHSLPLNHIRLKEKYSRYMQEGYTSLIHKGFCNDNSRKVSDRMEQLILSLYVMPNKPYTTSVHDLYMQFLAGKLEVVDCRTGELYDREDFFDKNRVPVIISESTVWNYLNDPRNRAVVDKLRSNALRYNTKHRPHVHRKEPEWSLSKVSLDDQDLAKMPDGKRVKAYRIFDVKSQVIIGTAYSKTKEAGLFIECIRDMVLFLKKHHLGIPLEAEVENHLVNLFKDDMMKEGNLFEYVRWCNAANPREKYAETGIRTLKYGTDKKYNSGVGRFYLRNDSNVPKQEKVFDGDNNNYKGNTRTYDEIVATDLEIVQKHNNSLHPKQKLYPGMTRMEVLLSKVNPEVGIMDNARVARYIGNQTKTSIYSSQYIKLNYQNWMIEGPHVLSRLMPHNYSVDCYWLPDEKEVYIYQNDKFISSCRLIEKFNTAAAEQTDRDKEIFTDQQKFISKFDKQVKDGAEQLARIKVIENTDMLTGDIPLKVVDVVPEPVPVEEFEVSPEETADYYGERGFDSL